MLRCPQLGLFSLFVLSIVLGCPVRGQGIIVDQTLPRSSIINIDGDTTIITGGTRAEQNLFHSFQAFSIPINETASFQEIDPRISNIFARITGNSLSRIDGIIETLLIDGSISSANFFLLNPQGIVFGPNSALNVGGSFLATTADSIFFEDGTEFHAHPTQESSLLTVSVPVGIQFGSNPGGIRNQSRSNLVLREPFNNLIMGGLQVPSGRTLALLGGTIQLQGGVITADNGRIELGSIAGEESVTIQEARRGWQFDYSNTNNFDLIRLTTGSVIGGIQGSGIELHGHRITFSQESQLFSETELEKALPIRLQATEAILLQNSLIGTRTLGIRDAGRLVIQTPLLRMQNSTLLSETLAEGRSGSVRLRTNDIRILENSLLGSRTLSDGQGSNVWIRASNSLFLSAQPISQDILDAPSLIFTSTQAEDTGASGASGDSGDIVISTRQLVLQNGAQITTTTFSSGDAGQLTIRAKEIELTGVRLDSNNRPLFTENGFTFGSALAAQAEESSSGNGGEIQIETYRLLVEDGAGIVTNTLDSGNAGDIHIEAEEFIEVRGAARGLNGQQVPSGIYSTAGGIQNLSVTNPNARGRGGNIFLHSPELRVFDDAFVAVSSASEELNAPGAGTLTIDASRILLNRGNLDASTESGNLANIRLRNADFLLLSNNSRINTSAGFLTDGGTGGDITINADLIVADANNNDITANAVQENAGNIEVTASTILGIEPRPELTPLSDITATSELGVDGNIIIESPDTDLEQGVIELPSQIVEAEVIQGCAGDIYTAEQENTDVNSFTIVGQGGLPPDYTGVLEREWVLTTWSIPNVRSSSHRRPSNTNSSLGSADNPYPKPDSSEDLLSVTEAQGWLVNSIGEIVLTANSVLPQHYLEEGTNHFYCSG